MATTEDGARRNYEGGCSGRAPLVVPVKAASFLDFHNFPALGRLHKPRIRAVSLQRPVTRSPAARACRSAISAPRHRTPLQIVMELPTLDAIHRLVAAWVGVALGPRRAAESEIARGEVVPIDVVDLRLPRSVNLVYRAAVELSYAAAASVACAREGLRAPPLGKPGRPFDALPLAQGSPARTMISRSAGTSG